MAEGAVGASRPRGGLPPLPLCVSRDDELFNRRIEFHPARRPFSGFSLSGGDFHIETLNPGPETGGPTAQGGGYCSSSSGAASSGKRPDGGELHQGGLDPELSFEITFRRIGAGLANLGNTCFLNSVLQCLTYTEPFAAYLQSGKHKSSCRAAGFCAMCALQNHVMDALQSTGKILRPFHLVKNLRCVSRNFRNSRQEDAHEYMINLLESMHKCCLPSGIASETSSAYEKSLVHRIFGGRLRSQVKCMQCSYCSNKFDPFLDLSLEIVKADSLCKALSHFTSEEQLDGGERQYQCQQCKQKVRALKQLTIHKAPYVLTIHLKRFGSDMPGQKIDKKVDFESTLDLKPYVSSPEGDLNYTLYGVLVHAGHGTHSGHYFCFVRTSTGMWHSLNDHQVYQVSEKTVLQQKAYMLFYVCNVRSFAPKRGQDCPASCHGESMSLNGISVSEHLLKKVSVMSTNDLLIKTQQPTLLEDHMVHSSSKISSIEKASKIGASLQDAAGQHLVVKSLMHPSSSKDNGNHLLEKDDLQNMTPRKSGTQARNHIGNASGEQINAGSKQYTAFDSPQMQPMKHSDSQKSLTKRKLLPKSFYERHMLFGSRRLFVVALNLQKRKKLQMRKRHLSTKEIRKAQILMDNDKGDQGESTSVMVNMVDVNSKQRPRVSSGRENVSHGNVNNVCSGSTNATDVDDGGRHLNNNTKRSMLSEEQEHITVEACTSSYSSSQYSAMNLSKRGIWEMPVPQWDSIELPPEIDVTDDEPQSIGYILDDWEKELDRGKRKKVKSSKMLFVEGNPFKDLSAARAQKRMKMDWTRSGNKPFRINT